MFIALPKLGFMSLGTVGRKSGSLMQFNAGADRAFVRGNFQPF
jgi:hypothetical protein